jgi:hypothetical protein
MGEVACHDATYAITRLVSSEIGAKSELNSLTHRISQHVTGFIEREGLLVRDENNDYLACDGLEGDPMFQIQGYSITYRIATGQQQGRKVFILHYAPMAEQGLAAG